MGAYSEPAPKSLTEMMDKLNKYPHEVSTELLKPFAPPQTTPFAPRNSTLLDAGCGTNANLAKWAIQNFGLYVGLDNGRTQLQDGSVRRNADILSARLGAAYCNSITPPYRILDADVRNIPPAIPAASVAHMRFVLMHLQPEEWTGVIKGLHAKAQKGMVFMEYDWEVMDSTHKYAVHIHNFKRFSLELMKKLRISPFIGHDLQGIVERAIPCKTQYRVFSRPDGGEISDLIALSAMQKDVAAKAGLQELSSQFGHLETAFQFFTERENPIPLPYTPPNICAVTVWP